MIPYSHHQAAADVDMALRKAWRGMASFDSSVSVKATEEDVTVFAHGDAVTNWVRAQNPWKLAGKVPLVLMHRGSPR